MLLYDVFVISTLFTQRNPNQHLKITILTPIKIAMKLSSHAAPTFLLGDVNKFSSNNFTCLVLLTVFYFHQSGDHL